jgi:hypothetical protein
LPPPLPAVAHAHIQPNIGHKLVGMVKRLAHETRRHCGRRHRPDPWHRLQRRHQRFPPRDCRDLPIQCRLLVRQPRDCCRQRRGSSRQRRSLLPQPREGVANPLARGLQLVEVIHRLTLDRKEWQVGSETIARQAITVHPIRLGARRERGEAVLRPLRLGEQHRPPRRSRLRDDGPTVDPRRLDDPRTRRVSPLHQPRNPGGAVRHGHLPIGSLIARHEQRTGQGGFTHIDPQHGSFSRRPRSLAAIDRPDRPAVGFLIGDGTSRSAHSPGPSPMGGKGWLVVAVHPIHR